MISHENANDLIDTVTAEIEAIIQEEINSQNLDAVTGEVKISEENETAPQETVSIEAPVEAVSTVAEPETLEVKEEIAPQEEMVVNEENTPLQEDTVSEASEALVTQVEELSEPQELKAMDNVVELESEVNKTEIMTEYTVQIGSPSQEKDVEVVENLVAVPLIETILNDAPIDDNDGPRTKHFKQALRKALNNTVKSCSGDKLETCFPFNLKADQFSQINATILTALKSVIDGVHEPFNEFLKSESLVDKLNKVDDFTRSRVPGASGTSEAALLASLTPQDLIDRKIHSSKLASLAKLEQLAQKVETENAQLFSELNNRQTEFADRLDRLKSSQQLLDAALDQISTISMDDLEVLVDKMNHQYQPSALKIHN